ncbi:MAG: hypothetical protein ACRDOD_10725 [Streptosporangiaceae bacterium]
MGVQTGIRPAGMLADLAAEFPGWHIWRGRDGRGADQGWFATRRRRPTAAEAATGLVVTLSAGDAMSLRGMLAQQQVIGALAEGGMQ